MSTDFERRLLDWMARIDQRLGRIDARLDTMSVVVQDHGAAIEHLETAAIVAQEGEEP